MDKWVLKDIEQAFQQLEFAIRLMSYCGLGYIDKEKFNSHIYIESENLILPRDTFKEDRDLGIAAQINVGVCFGVSAIVLDAAFDADGFKKTPESENREDLIRTLVFMIRCAFAHNMAFPRWEVRGPYNRKIEFGLFDEHLSIDLRELHGQLFEYSHIGGAGNWFKIRDVSVELLNSSKFD